MRSPQPNQKPTPPKPRVSLLTKLRVLYIHSKDGLLRFFKKLTPGFAKIGVWSLPLLKFIKNFLLIVIIYGFLVNYVFTYFWKFELTPASIAAFGLFAYFVKYEVVSVIISIRGPKAPPIVMK
jgi:hypothetical protein